MPSPFSQTEEGSRRAPPDPDEVALAQLAELELKLQRLRWELQGQDLAAVMREMEEEKVTSPLALWPTNWGQSREPKVTFAAC